ncbi:sensor [Nitrospira sp. KM1]|nr:sensor [Nitrospira sp. KM1]
MSESGEKSDLRSEAIAWVIRLRNSRLSSEDRKAFESWQAQSPAHATAFQQVSAVWDDPELGAAATHAARIHAPQAVVQRNPFRRSWRYQAAAVAAGVVLLVLAVVPLDFLTRMQADYYTVAGERRTVQLPDQSTVMLNTQTAIAMSFDGSTRQIRLLKGEAFFKIRQDPDRPFIVESDDTSTRAVGTEFVVRAQRDRDQVTVVEGIVEVRSRAGHDAAARVGGGFQVRMTDGHLGQPQAVDASAASAWIKGRLVVNGVPLAQVIDEVRRYHPGTIIFLNHGIGDTKVTGTYNLTEPSKILTLLSNTFPLHVVGLADRIVLMY